VIGSPNGNADARCCTTRFRNAHRTESEEEREVLYRWHPWAGCVVRVHRAIERIGGTVLRCSSGSGASERSLEVPAWMFDRATCIATRVTSDPVVEFRALKALQELLVATTVYDAPASSSNPPVSSPADQARNQNWGKDDAATVPISSEGLQTSSATRAVHQTNADSQRYGSDLASAARRDTAGADGVKAHTDYCY